MISRLFDLSEIKIRRKKLGITQKELAERAGVSQALIAKIESGQVDPRYSTLRRILNALEELEKERIKANNIMTRDIVYAEEDEPLLDAISKMISKGYSQLPVRDSNGRITGNLDEEVVVRSMMKYDPDKLKNVKVKDVMKPPLPTVPPNAGIGTLISILSESSAVLVVDKGGNPKGIITRSDVLEYLRSLGQKL
ncbi:MAG: CBS domain-containing protein [Euryarchaeota archaeon]|nr:CBS domain-containing protein [Euryarchaeota archaeon]